MHNHIQKILFVLFCAVFLTANVLSAQERSLGAIDKNESYDIYYARSSGFDGFVIKRVKVVRIDSINGQDFLVFINDAGFNAKGKEGFILFSSVSAIVPSSTFSISNFERGKQN